VVFLDALGMADVARVGGKNASLGEMLSRLAGAGVRVPMGFATTVAAYREFLAAAGLGQRIRERLHGLDTGDVAALEAAGRSVRGWLLQAELPPALCAAVERAYARLAGEAAADFAVAVRSSATAEDLAEASFAGQQESWLNVRGCDGVMQAIRQVYASLYNDRAIAYRAHHGFAHEAVGISAGVQHMVRSDRGTSGVMFSVDPESGFHQVVMINAGYGLGETVVQGVVNPDEFYVYKPALRAGRTAVLRRILGEKQVRMVYADAGQDGSGVVTEPVAAAERARFCLDDVQVEALARLALVIEQHYDRPMDIEWALDGLSGELYIVQARPETVQSRGGQVLERYRLRPTAAAPLAQGRSIGQRIGQGRVRVLHGLEQMDRVAPGDVLVTAMTNPDWEPVMQQAAAIVTDRGGRTCHAAIIARELGIPAVVGCGDATRRVADGSEVTVSCAEGDTGHVYAGSLDFEVSRIELDHMPEPPVRIMMNVSNPDQAFRFGMLPNHGVGLARLEFVINRMIGIHPRALLEYERLPTELRQAIDRRTAAYADPVDFYVERLVEGIATLAAAFDPNPVIVRFSDFKSNEYANLVGGDRYEPREENPMLGFRGAARYLSPEFRECFRLECRAIRKVREQLGLANVQVMVPFVRNPREARATMAILREFGLERGAGGLRVIMMCELPCNAFAAEDFLPHFDGFSIGSNDLTQLMLGVDRDSGLVADRFDEGEPAVKAAMHHAIAACKAAGKYVGICGQGPSDNPALAAWLVAEGIASISLNPDTVIDTWLQLATPASKPP